MLTADYFVERLRMEPHPEGGFYKEIYQSPIAIDNICLPPGFEGNRKLSSTIYFLLKAGQVSQLHKLRSDEVWFFHYGSPLEMHLVDERGSHVVKRLGLNPEKGESPQLPVPADMIFGARPSEKSGFTLVSTMVSPGFEFRDFELFKTEDVCKMFPHLRDTLSEIFL
ncbi:MAG: cupin domain-containing protein [Bacteroidales bacterium]